MLHHLTRLHSPRPKSTCVLPPLLSLPLSLLLSLSPSLSLSLSLSLPLSLSLSLPLSLFLSPSTLSSFPLPSLPPLSFLALLSREYKCQKVNWLTRATGSHCGLPGSVVAHVDSVSAAVRKAAANPHCGGPC